MISQHLTKSSTRSAFGIHFQAQHFIQVPCFIWLPRSAAVIVDVHHCLNSSFTGITLCLVSLLHCEQGLPLPAAGLNVISLVSQMARTPGIPTLHPAFCQPSVIFMLCRHSSIIWSAALSLHIHYYLRLLSCQSLKVTVAIGNVAIRRKLARCGNRIMAIHQPNGLKLFLYFPGWSRSSACRQSFCLFIQPSVGPAARPYYLQSL